MVSVLVRPFLLYMRKLTYKLAYRTAFPPRLPGLLARRGLVRSLEDEKVKEGISILMGKLRQHQAKRLGLQHQAKS
jgi:hypothetical protein